MKLSIAPGILKDFSGLTIGIVVAHVGEPCQKQPDIDRLMHAQEELLAHALTKETLGRHPSVLVWREAYKKFGARPKDYPSSVERLAQRVIAGRKLPSISPLVDLYNYISLKYLLPVGGEDLALVEGDITLAYAGADESPVTLLGETEARVPPAGEVLYKDAQGALCRRWNWKEAERTKITEKTKHAVFVIESLGSKDPRLMRNATFELAALIERYCKGSTSVTFLDEQRPEVVLKDGATWATLEPVGELEEMTISPYALEEERVQHEKTSSEHAIRAEKVRLLREKGYEPWPLNKTVSATCAEVVSAFEATGQSATYQVAGRIMSLRVHGKAAFADIQDRSGRLQIYVKQDCIGNEQFSLFTTLIDIGDIVWCSGFSFRTKTGQITVEAESFTLLSKSLYPLPEKFHGLTHIETKYRQRYLDLIINPATRERFVKRSQIIKGIRNYLDAQDFVEVETPMLHPIAGGAAARPFVTHHNALNTNFYLRIAPELYLKRLVIGGIERVYEINRNFRNEGVSTRHNPEFTMLELYMAYEDYRFIMGFVEELLRNLARTVSLTLQLPYDQYTLDFEQPFIRMPMRSALITYGGLSEQDLSPMALDETLKTHAISVAAGASEGEKIYALFEVLAESKLIQPTFITDFPIEVSPLAKRDPNNPAIASRFELFIAGMELSNGFSELNDPYDQAERFKEQVAEGARGNDEAHQYDSDYVHALEYGLAPTVGVGIGIDRLVMLLTNTPSIKEVILFPTLKRKEK